MQFGQIWNLFCGVNLFQYNSCLHRFHFDGQLAYKTLVIGRGEMSKNVLSTQRWNQTNLQHTYGKLV